MTFSAKASAYLSGVTLILILLTIIVLGGLFWSRHEYFPLKTRVFPLVAFHIFLAFILAVITTIFQLEQTFHPNEQVSWSCIGIALPVSIISTLFFDALIVRSFSLFLRFKIQKEVFRNFSRVQRNDALKITATKQGAGISHTLSHGFDTNIEIKSPLSHYAFVKRSEVSAIELFQFVVSIVAFQVIKFGIAIYMVNETLYAQVGTEECIFCLQAFMVSGIFNILFTICIFAFVLFSVRNERDSSLSKKEFMSHMMIFIYIACLLSLQLILMDKSFFEIFNLLAVLIPVFLHVWITLFYPIFVMNSLKVLDEDADLKPEEDPILHLETESSRPDDLSLEFQAIIADVTGLTVFTKFLVKELSAENILFIKDVETFENDFDLYTEELALKNAIRIFNMYICESAHLMVALSYPVRIDLIHAFDVLCPLSIKQDGAESELMAAVAQFMFLGRRDSRKQFEKIQRTSFDEAVSDSSRMQLSKDIFSRARKEVTFSILTDSFLRFRRTNAFAKFKAKRF